MWRFLILLASMTVANGEVIHLRFASPFTSHAVLQRGVEVPVWGTANPGLEFKVQFGGQTIATTADAEGRWQVALAPMEASSVGQKLSISTERAGRSIDDILVGEVWYASGQSNMDMRLEACARRLPAIAEVMASEGVLPIRILEINEPDSPNPLNHLENLTLWKTDEESNRGKFSGLAYLFARQLYDEIRVPIGIIETAWGGKPIEGFIPRTAYAEREGLRSILELADRNELKELAAMRGGVVVRNTAGLPGRIYNARVAPVLPYAIKGFLWYQGESNAGTGEDPRDYRWKTKALIDGWRQAWRDSKLPFYFVQLPAYPRAAPGWIRMREEQRLALANADTGMAVTIDLVDEDIHPANKWDLAKRLVRWPLAKLYGKEMSFSGPLYQSFERTGTSLKLSFQYVEGGLMIGQKEGLGSVEESSDALRCFEVANEKGEWFDAGAVIEGDSVVVSSSKVMLPAAVRYACQGAPDRPNLYNRSGLPASPFCSRLDWLPWGEKE
jgi:sialate O-acetylesterase